jgi:alpha-glucuronidase
MSRILAAAFLVLLAVPARAEDGYDLWLRYRPMEAGARAQYRPLATVIVSEGTSRRCGRCAAPRRR